MGKVQEKNRGREMIQVREIGVKELAFHVPIPVWSLGAACDSSENHSKHETKKRVLSVDWYICKPHQNENNKWIYHFWGWKDISKNPGNNCLKVLSVFIISKVWWLVFRVEGILKFYIKSSSLHNIVAAFNVSKLNPCKWFRWKTIVQRYFYQNGI